MGLQMEKICRACGKTFENRASEFCSSLCASEFLKKDLFHKNQEIMNKKICRNCGIIFEDVHEKFCSQACKEVYIIGLEKRIREVVEKDSSHIKKLSI